MTKKEKRNKIIESESESDEESDIEDQSMEYNSEDSYTSYVSEEPMSRGTDEEYEWSGSADSDAEERLEKEEKKDKGQSTMEKYYQLNMYALKNLDTKINDS